MKDQELKIEECVGELLDYEKDLEYFRSKVFAALMMPAELLGVGGTQRLELYSAQLEEAARARRLRDVE